MTLAVEISVRLRHHARRWRDGRAVECTGLENQQGVTAFQGSNPCPSAIQLSHSVSYLPIPELFQSLRACYYPICSHGVPRILTRSWCTFGGIF